MEVTNNTQETVAQLDIFKAEIAKLKAENAKLSAVKEKGLSFRVSAKGGVSVYGMGRFPTTLYRSQWVKLLGAKDGILAFLKANEADLKEKGDAPKVAQADAKAA